MCALSFQRLLPAIIQQIIVILWFLTTVPADKGGSGFDIIVNGNFSLNDLQGTTDSSSNRNGQVTSNPNLTIISGDEEVNDQIFKADVLTDVPQEFPNRNESTFNTDWWDSLNLTDTDGEFEEIDDSFHLHPAIKDYILREHNRIRLKGMDWFWYFSFLAFLLAIVLVLGLFLTTYFRIIGLQQRQGHSRNPDEVMPRALIP